MNKRISFSLLFSLAALSINDVEAHTHHEYIVEQPVIITSEPLVVVDTAPPAEVEEKKGTSPGVNYVWIKGHWQWDGHKWELIHGNWVVRPNAAAVWEPGNWKEHGHHWRWTAGRWKY